MGSSHTVTESDTWVVSPGGDELHVEGRADTIPEVVQLLLGPPPVSKSTAFSSRLVHRFDACTSVAPKEVSDELRSAEATYRAMFLGRPTGRRTSSVHRCRASTVD
jgi:hypothetical protein